MFIVLDGAITGLVCVADTVKESTPAVLKALHALGFRIIMATGDNERTAFGILIGPIFAAFAMSASSLLVVLNALRLRTVNI